jgi:hypothetical protein
MMKLIYKPFGMLVGLLAGFLGRALFSRIWAMIDKEEPPEATTEQTTWPKVLVAAALEGLIFRVVKVAIDRAGAIGWSRLTGIWPGKRAPEPE